MRHLGFALATFAITSAGALSAQEIPDRVAQAPITLTGCVTAGEKANTYVLTHVVSSTEPVSSTGPVGTSGSVGTGRPVGTSGRPVMPFYWFDEPSKLKGHVGHQVEIAGMLDGDVDKTKVEVKDGSVEMKADRKTVKVPEGSAAAAALPRWEAKEAGYKVKVKTVKTIAGSCGS